MEWLEPESDKGQRSTVMAHKIPSFEDGLTIDQEVLCRWGSRKYKAIVRSIEGLGEQYLCGITCNSSTELFHIYPKYRQRKCTDSTSHQRIYSYELGSEKMVLKNQVQRKGITNKYILVQFPGKVYSNLSHFTSVFKF